MITIKKNYTIKGISALQLFRISHELDSIEVPFEAFQDKRNPKIFGIVVSDADKTKAIVAFTKVKSTEI